MTLHSRATHEIVNMKY